MPVRPALSVAAIVGVIAIGALFILLFQNKRSSVPPSQQYQAQVVPTATPTPVDTSTWKTYTDWKYHYSVKLPPEFASYIPTKGYTGDTIDPDGTGFVQFEDRTLSGDYPNRIAKYGFYFRLEKGAPVGSSCTTDQECLNSNRNFYHNTPGGMRVVPIQARILNRDIQGLAIQTTTDNTSSPTGKDISIQYLYTFIVNGKPFNAEINFYYPKGFQQAQTKDPVINAILSSISFDNQ